MRKDWPVNETHLVRQMFLDFENLSGIPVNAAAAFVGENAPYCRTRPLSGMATSPDHLPGQAAAAPLKAKFLGLSGEPCTFGLLPDGSGPIPESLHFAADGAGRG
jgi:hypothetical protein